ncbi:TPR repeat-containing protein [Rubidibacter lacunae KORDI 51-2]|uniref:TPR repeat-containing protein n=1 Tax=Rubidibacter lacunae KORDI 51-2 TaxID=582515 RepID=U5DGY4_9CHRO|nr:tetratricopeptide repeat protein [Rubidibacter lacunae]ERN39819.1 TPR repeat-containing protein [Rubidibacter lacunae KORDI 51-2]
MARYEEGAYAFNTENYEKAMRIMLPLAREGDVNAQLSVASMYFSGLGVQQDYRQAIKWYRPGAEQGHPVAQHSLAIALLSLDIIDEAIEYLLEADKQNVTVAQSCLGDIFTGAYNFPKEALEKFDFSFDEALEWYQKAGEGGFPYAYHRLGEISEARGGDSQENEAVALDFYHKAAKQGYVPSQMVLARAYQDGLLGLPIDLEQAQYWFRQAQENN